MKEKQTDCGKMPGSTLFISYSSLLRSRQTPHKNIPKSKMSELSRKWEHLNIRLIFDKSEESKIDEF